MYDAMELNVWYIIRRHGLLIDHDLIRSLC